MMFDNTNKISKLQYTDKIKNQLFVLQLALFQLQLGHMVN